MLAEVGDAEQRREAEAALIEELLLCTLLLACLLTEVKWGFCRL